MKSSQLSLFSKKEEKEFSTSEKDHKARLREDFINQKKGKGIALAALLPVKKRSRIDSINLDGLATQQTLYSWSGKDNWTFLSFFPKFSIEEKDVLRIVRQVLKSPDKLLGLDFEFTRGHVIKVTGVASVEECAACFDSETVIDALQDFLSAGGKFVGHFVLGADKVVLDNRLQLTSSREQWLDSMLSHFLTSAALCKAPGKEESEGTQGFMSLGFATALWTSIPAGYKNCRGRDCHPSEPCPTHNVRAYCAVDAWAGLQVWLKTSEMMKDFRKTYPLYNFKGKS